MINFLYTLIFMSISGSVMYLLALLFHARTGRKFSGSFYLMLTSAILLFLVPIRNIKILPSMVTIPVSTDAPVIYSAVLTADAAQGVPALTADAVIFAVWAAAAVFLALRLAIQYIKTRKLLLKSSCPLFDEKASGLMHEVRRTLKIRRSIKIRKSRFLQSPLLFGIFSPAIILPEREFSEAELKMILLHELTHYRHKDILIKLLCSAAVCVHWFNPAVYFLRKSLNKSCELFCDEAVLSELSPSDKKSYGRLILSVIEYSTCPGTRFSTLMASPKESLRQRLIKIMSFKKISPPVKAVCTVLAFMMTVCSLTAFGFEAAVEILPESIKRELPTPVPSAAPQHTPRQTAAPEATGVPVKITETPAATKPPETAKPPMPSGTPRPAPVPTEQSPEREAIDLCESSCVLLTDPENTAETVKSDTLTVSETSPVYVSRTDAHSTALICIYDADTGEPVYEEKDESEIIRHFSFPLEKGKKIYLTVKSDSAAEESIYIGAENRKENSI